MGGSPSVKLTMTDPALTALPQSSTTSTAIAVGHAAGALKPVAIVVNTGSSLLGVQVVVAFGVKETGGLDVPRSPKVPAAVGRFAGSRR